MPSNPFDAKGLLAAAIQDDNPVIFLEQKLLFFGDAGARARGALRDRARQGERRPGGQRRHDRGARRHGPARAPGRARARGARGSSVEVVDPRTLVPLDTDTIAASVAKTHRVVVVHEAVQFGGYGAEIAAHIGEHCFWELDAPVVRIGAPSHPMPYQKDLELATLPGAGPDRRRRPLARAAVAPTSRRRCRRRRRPAAAAPAGTGAGRRRRGRSRSRAPAGRSPGRACPSGRSGGTRSRPRRATARRR